MRRGRRRKIGAGGVRRRRDCCYHRRRGGYLGMSGRVRMRMDRIGRGGSGRMCGLTSFFFLFLGFVWVFELFGRWRGCVVVWEDPSSVELRVEGSLGLVRGRVMAGDVESRFETW